jgi:hypothetical protein
MVLSVPRYLQALSGSKHPGTQAVHSIRWLRFPVSAYAHSGRSMSVKWS